ncbi:MAG TPA: glutamyl-tRNA reductase [Anaerolineae bacterium]|nr:glutamyl-tRNA reductase [Anaerolineae bacterium]
MHILCLGLSHQTAPIELRERVSYNAGAQKAALARLGCGHASRPPELVELAILSTCTRLEFYAVTRADRPEPLLQFIEETTGVPTPELMPYLYQRTQAEAVLHLGRVASGLDSMILGEPQILGQVTEAYELGLSQRSIGPVLSTLFRYAIHTGKRARTETAISRNPASTSSVAVKLAEEVVGNLHTAHTVIVGAGEMAELAAEALQRRGVQHITVVNRTHDRAQPLAARWGAVALTFEHLAEALIDADIVISSTGAPHILIKLPLVESVMRQRPDRPLVFIDIAVPRDVDPDINQIPNVRCYDIDHLDARLTDSLAERQQEVPQVETIITVETEAFMTWLNSLEIMPVISDLRAKADSIRRAEVDKTLRQLKGLSEADRQRIEAMSEALVNKLLHDATLRLKAEAGNGHAAEYAAAVRHLFALNPANNTL